ncbi:MAG TPA: Na+/H+ antiporter [Longilinea sp.]|nr:Na+/H+ antiporter [Longilinea sp.]
MYHHGKLANPLRIVLTICLLAFMLSSCAAFSLSSTSQGSTEAATENHGISSLVQTEVIIIGLLLVAATVSVIASRLRIPYTIGLVIVGLALTLVGKMPLLAITPEIILTILVPPLIFEAAFHLNYSDLRKELPLILSLAVLGVILTTLLVGGLVAATAKLSLSTALLFGALISATDPVAVIALFRTMGAPRRLQVLLEGESLLNDGTAIVLYSLMLSFALTGQFNLGQSVLQFFITAGGGILVGAILGILVSRMIGSIDNYLVETTLTTVLAYGSYLIAQYLFGFSGVLAVVAAGLASGQLGPKGMSPTTRIVVFNFWEYAAFLANTFVFLIIGLQIDLNSLVSNAAAIGWAILAVLVARAVTIYGLSWIGKNISVRWKNVLFWGGLRGAISLALALSLAMDIPSRAQLQAMAFGVVLFTLLVEGLTMRPLVQKSGLIFNKPAQQNYEKLHARVIALRSAKTRLERLNRDGLVSDYTWHTIQSAIAKQQENLTSQMHAVLESEPELHEDELSDTYRESLRTQRSALATLFHDNLISEETYEILVSEVDGLLANPESTWPGLNDKPDES